MILNNYRALQFMREEMGERLSPDAILELHRIVTEGTLDDPAAAGRLQRPGEERVAVFDRDDDERPIHSPPPAEELPERMRLLCEFANEDDDGRARSSTRSCERSSCTSGFAYDHPFEDGNGRTARILFFWLMRDAATGWSSTCRSRRSFEKRPPSTAGPSSRRRPTKATRPTS